MLRALIVFGSDEPEYDDHCASCGAGYYFEVGLQITCDKCGGSLTKPTVIVTSEESKLDDVYLDEDFMNFDERKAFIYMREHGLLHEAYRVQPDPVEEFLDAVDGPEELDFKVTSYPGMVNILPPNVSMKPLKRP